MSINREIRNRILVSVAAYAYECMGDSIMSDNEYDVLALSINPELDTGNILLDNFFKTEFSSYTGQWIHEHPELTKIETIYKKYYAHARTA
jgi:hypothetical protein